MNRRVFERLSESFTPKWSLRDPVSLRLLRDRIAERGRRAECLSYSDLADGVTFHVPDPHRISVGSWSDFDRALIGDFLGALSIESYRQHCFLISALAVHKETGVPSDHFLRWVAHAYEQDVLMATVTWERHRDRAFACFSGDPSFQQPCPACPL